MRKVDDGEKKKKRKKIKECCLWWPLTLLPVGPPNADRLERRTLVPKRKEMEKALGLNRLADEIRQTSEGFINNSDLMYNSDESD